MTAAAGPYLAGCILLMVAGVAKVRAPAATQRALAGVRRQGLAVPASIVRVGGMAELVVGATAFSTAAAGPAVAVTMCYMAFVGFVSASLVRDGGASGCGCFGEAGGAVPLGGLHIAVNAALAVAALAVAADGGLHAPLVDRALVSVAAAGLAWAGFLVLVPLPALMVTVRAARR